MATKDFAPMPLALMALNSVTIFFGYGKTYTAIIQVVRHIDTTKITAGKTPSLPHSQEILLGTKTVLRRKLLIQAERRLRPLARRRLIKARPERVAIRARKP